MGNKKTSFFDSSIPNFSRTTQHCITAVDIVLNAVRSVFQTYVESLKNSGNFNSEAQKIAFNLAKSLVLKQLSEDAKNYISKNYGDLEEWIRSQIEASIYKLKN